MRRGNISGDDNNKTSPASTGGVESTREDSTEENLEQLLEQRASLESKLHRKFIKHISVMFTDLPGSTTYAEEEGDLAARLLLKRYYDIVIPNIEQGKGKLVKTMGDGTLSYFESAQDAVTTAVRIQQAAVGTGTERSLDAATNASMRMRIGIHTNSGIVENTDIFGDVVNVASRFETLAAPGEIFFSEETYSALSDKDEVYCRFIKHSSLKGKSAVFKIYKAFYLDAEIAADRARPETSTQAKPEGAITRPGDETRLYNYSQSRHELADEFDQLGASLVVQRDEEDKQVFPLTKNEIVAGRHSSCDLVLKESYISRKHMRISLKAGSYWVEDLDSGLGVILNDNKIASGALTNGDEMLIGSLRIVFVNHQQGAGGAEDEATKKYVAALSFKLAVIDQNGQIEEYKIGKKGLSIGRSPSSDVSLDSPAVSRRHARISLHLDQVMIEDMGSNNGTIVGQQRLSEAQPVEVGAQQLIRIAGYQLMVVKDDPSDPALTPKGWASED